MSTPDHQRSLSAAWHAAVVSLTAEAIAYVCLFVYAGAQLGHGAADATQHIDIRLLGVPLLTGSRQANSSTITSSLWLLPTLALLAVAVTVTVYFARRNSALRH